MATHDLPQARVVRSHGLAIAPPPAPPREPGVVGAQLRSALGVALGLWPLTAAMLLMLGLFALAASYGNP